MGRVITFQDGKVVEDREVADPAPADLEAEATALRERLAALEEQAAKP